jgi:HSP20 family protein
MAIVRYNPTGFGELQKEINRLFNVWDDNESSGATAGWIPSVDIQEYADRFQLFVDLPGVDPKDVDITLDGGVLTVSGERNFPQAAGEQVVTRRTERGQGRFYRRFALPETVDSENVKATGRDGVLEITIPKHAKAQPRRIEVVS